MIKKIPVIIDTDFGGDPDDSIALLYALFSSEIEISAIFTADEYRKNHRAVVLKKWLRSRNSTIPIFSGFDLGNTNLFLLDHHYSDESIPSLRSSLDRIEKLLISLKANNGCYISIGGLSNLNFLVEKFPNLFKSLSLYIMGGAFNYITPNTAEHNIRLDIKSAEHIFHSKLSTKWILSDSTFIPELKISPTHKLYKELSKKKGFFFELIKENMDIFYTTRFPDSYLHDPVTVSSVFLNPIEFGEINVQFEKNGEFKIAKSAEKITVSTRIHPNIFWKDFYAKFPLKTL